MSDIFLLGITSLEGKLQDILLKYDTLREAQKDSAVIVDDSIQANPLFEVILLQTHTIAQQRGKKTLLYNLDASIKRLD